jgi:hypothetical protein
MNLRSAPTGFGALDGLGFAADDAAGSAPIHADDVFFVRGWAVDPAYRPGTHVFVGIDDGDPVDATTGLSRPDVAQALGTPQALTAGFVAALAVGSVAPGKHTVWASFRSGTEHFRVPGELAIDVLPAHDPLAGLLTRTEGWAIRFDGVYVGEDRLATSLDESIVLAPGSRATLRGWAVDVMARKPAAEIFVKDETGMRRAAIGFDRPDVGDNLGMPDVRACGFNVPLLAPIAAEDAVHIVTLSADRRSYYEAGVFRIGRGVAESTASRARLETPANAVIDDIWRNDVLCDMSDGELAFAREDLLSIRGWAIDGVHAALPAGVTIVVDDHYEVVAQARLERPDVAAELGNSNVRACGFVAQVPLGDLPTGEHRLAARVIAADGSGFYEGHSLAFRTRG